MTPPTSLILPTVRWTDACDDVVQQLGPDDELLVVCDAVSDPVAGRFDGGNGFDTAATVELVVAGDPEGCSGKANAIAAGMETATSDRIVWTDDDFDRHDDWLDGLHAAYERHGPVSEAPIFVGADPLAVLLEPLYTFGGTYTVIEDDLAWAGSLVFEREDIDEQAFLDALGQTVSDDGLVTEYLDLTTIERTHRVEVGGSVRETLERHVRWAKIPRFHTPGSFAVSNLVGVVVAVVCLLVPLLGAVGITLAQAAIYRRVGNDRWTYLLAFPAALLSPFLMGYALARRTFVWGGRRYRWRRKFDVEVESA